MEMNPARKVDADDAAAEFLSKTLGLDGFFLEFKTEQIRGVFPHGGLFSYPAGHRLISQNDRCQDLFVIYEGSVEVVRAFRNEQIVLGKGDIFGEMSIVQDGKRNAAVIVKEPSRIFFLPYHDLQYVMANNPEVGKRLRELAMHRL